MLFSDILDLLGGGGDIESFGSAKHEDTDEESERSVNE
jgi:hypothetical protein